jgi:transposase
MFFRVKTSGPRAYLQIVENRREHGAHRQHVIATLGRIDELEGRLAEEAKFDGVFVLRTNTRLHPLQAMLRYRDLLQVEELFRRTKSALRTRPIYHSSDAAIRGHVFWSFLALMLQKELAMLCAAKGFRPEWQDLLRDLDRLQQAVIEKDGKRIVTRTHVEGMVGRVFQAAGIALPPHMRKLTNQTT